jgi:cephalosporin-C deacetylase-like acetyl esterase
MSRLSLVTVLILASISNSDDNPTRLFPNRSELKDVRLQKPRDLNGYFPFTPPADKASWNDRAAKVRTQLLVANGLWPLPEKTKLEPVIHGKIERDGYTVEKVFFASMPGHYVSGNLYRPTGKSDGKRPAILNPHGHWPNGRFMEAGDNEVKAQRALKDKATGQAAEGFDESARYPLQAKCIGLVRMGFVVFQYDMVGYADSTAITFNEGHRAGYKSTEAELRMQNIMGLQTWNSIRSLDFLSSLPDVDPKRIAVTGASGGGTQTFILCALDDRPAAAFPAVMVSTAMQGGCYCENCSYLRIGTGNVEFAAMFAPKPLAMSAANDWTLEIEKKGLPELQMLYKMLGVPDNIAGKCWPEFGHNYNQVSREMMYAWFNKHVLGKEGAVKEQGFAPIPPKELTVYDAEHPRPKDELDSKSLRARLAEASDAQMKAVEPKDAKSLDAYRKVVGPAVRVMLGEELPKPGSLKIHMPPKEVKLADGAVMHLSALGREGQGDMVPMAGVFKGKFDKGVVVWVHPGGKSSLVENGKLVPAALALVEKGYAIVAPDVFNTGELKGTWYPPEVEAKKKDPDPNTDYSKYPVNKNFLGYTYGYNPPVFSNRVHDILTAVMFARDTLKANTVHLVGWEGAGPWTTAARSVCGDAIARTAVDLNGFRFDEIKDVGDENMLPGAVKYGGMPAFLALCAPGEVFAHNHAGTSSGNLSKAAYDAAGASAALKRQPEKAKPEQVVEWLTR